MAPIKTSKKAKAANKYVIDVSKASSNGIFDTPAYTKYLVEHIKVDGNVGNLGDAITVTEEGDKVIVLSSAKFSGKYLKYLTKRYLKKNQLRDWLRVVSVKKGVYELKFFNVSAEEDEEEDEDDEE